MDKTMDQINDAQILAIALAEETCLRRRLEAENTVLMLELSKARMGRGITVLNEIGTDAAGLSESAIRNID